MKSTLSLKRRILIRGLLAVFSFLAIVLSLETAGRILIHQKYGHPGKSYGIWKSDRELYAAPRPNSYNTLTSLNNYGFRSREDVFEPKPKNSVRIIAFGGSTTFGYNLRDGETFPEKLQEKLRKVPGYEKTQVLNAGVVTYSAAQNFILMKRLIPQLKPDYVIIYEGLNEVLNAFALEREGRSLDNFQGIYGPISRSQDQNRWIKRNSVLVRFLDYSVQKVIHQLGQDATEAEFAVPPSFYHPWVLENYTVLFNQMLDYLLENNVKPVVIRYAIRSENKFLAKFPDISVKIAREKGVPVYDMVTDFDRYGSRRNDLFIHTGAHVTPEGAEILANGLYKIFDPRLRHSGMTDK